MSDKRDRAAIGAGFKEQQLGQTTDLAIMRRLWSYMAPYRWSFLACLLLLPILSGIDLLQPHLLQLAIDDHLVPGRFEGVGLLAGLFFGAVVLKALTQFGQLYLMQRAGQQALYDLRVEVFAHVQQLSMRYFHRNPVGRLMTRMTTDIESVQEAISSGMITMLGDAITLVAIIIVLLVKDWRLALVSFIVVPPLLGVTSLCRHFMRKAFRAIRVKIARLNAYLQEGVTGMRVIQLFGRERVSLSEYRVINEDYRAANYDSIRYDAALYAVVETVGSCAIGVIVWYGSGQVLRDALTLGVLIAFIEYMQRFFVPIRDLAQKYNLLQSAMASSERIFQLLDADDSLPSAPTPTPVPEGPLTLSFDDVWFAYSDEAWVLKGLSFTVAPGQRAALVGHTGAGKSTILNLLLRLHDVSRGAVRANGIDIREFDIAQWRARFAVVLQDSFLFRDTLAANIALGDSAMARERVEQAARTVHAHDLIMRYPLGYDHPIQERGGNLSAGERQLVAFARALAYQPEVLLLDEATANVDTETEARLQEAMEALLARQTSLVIAHRLSTIRSADVILVLHRGVLLEHGTHDALMAQGGHYHTLYLSM